jgi:hypothetical protein
MEHGAATMSFLSLVSEHGDVRKGVLTAPSAPSERRKPPRWHWRNRLLIHFKPRLLSIGNAMPDAVISKKSAPLFLPAPY